MSQSASLLGGTFSRQLARLLPSALASIGMTGLVNAPRQNGQHDSRIPARNTHARLDTYLRQEPEVLTPRSLRKLLTELQAVVDTKVSEVEAVRRAQPFVDWYLAAGHDERADAWRLMTEQFSPDAKKVKQAKDQYEAALGTEEEAQAEIRLRKAFHSPRTRLLQRLGATPGGMRFLLDLRTELLQQLRTEPALLPLDAELEHLFTGWFDIGFLELRTISWDSPASLIEKLIQYEAVHDIRSWDDAKNRLDHDRRCFAFFHPRLPNEPLIFVEVALTRAIADSMVPLLDVTASDADLKKANTAIFYSISNTQTGLRGVGFGDSLIKRVVEALQQELPQIRNFATLSPIPGLRKWLDKHAPDVAAALPTKTRAQYRVDDSLDEEAWNTGWPGTLDPAQPRDNDALPQQMLRGAAAMYLGSLDDSGRPLDPVARFHLGNGARVEHIHWGADPSAKGARQSYGLMVNYLYDLDKLDRHRAMLAAGKVAMSREVSRLKQFD